MYDQFSENRIFLDEKELAKRWSISIKTLQRWRWKGEGPLFVKFVGRVRYALSDIEAFERAHRYTNTGGGQPLGCFNSEIDSTMDRSNG